MKDEQGTIRGFNGIGKEVQESAQEAPNEPATCEGRITLSEFSAEIANELEGPLVLITGYTELLEKDVQDREIVKNTLKAVRKQIKSFRQIEEELHETAFHFLEMKPLDVNSCLEEIIDMLEPVLNLDRIFVKRSLFQELPLILANKRRLSKIFFNLINSSRLAVGPGGEVGIWTRHHNDLKEIEIIIGDNGPSVPQELIEVMFDPFPPTKKHWKRGGLWLYASQGMIRAHDGRMTVDSPPEDPELIAAGINVAFHIFIPGIKNA